MAMEINFTNICCSLPSLAIYKYLKNTYYGKNGGWVLPKKYPMCYLLT